MKIKLIFLAIFIFACFCDCADYANSISGLEVLLNVEKKLLTTLDGYIRANEAKLDILKRKLEEYATQNQKGLEDPEKYITNPLSAFSLIRRLSSDWPVLIEFLEKDGGESYLNVIKSDAKAADFPTANDLNQTAEGFVRMQRTYELNTLDVSKGLINGVQYEFDLNAKDLYDLGLHASARSHFHYADEWFKAALAKYDEEDGDVYYLNLTKETILQKAVDNKLAQEDFYVAFKYAKKLFDYTKRNKYADQLDEIDARIGFKEFQNRTNEEDEDFGEPSLDYLDVITNMGCRGEFTQIKQMTSEDKCVYVSQNHPFTKLAPFKAEIFNTIDPYMAVFHDVLSDSEIEILKGLAKPYLQRSKVNNDGTGDGTSESISRNSKIAWLPARIHDLLPVLTQRIEDLSGLSSSTSEDFQLVNYGFGGHYALHTDHFPSPKSLESFKRHSTSGSRIATLICYMSDVEQGGFTVFPIFLTSIKPKKGSCVLWYNLYPDMSGNEQTRHSGCPVLVGEKWAFNIWIQSNGQMFKKPCPADYNPKDEDAE